MNVTIEQRNVLIALGALGGVGLLQAFLRTWKWFSKTGREIIDLSTIGKLFFHIFGIMGTVLLLVAAGTSVFWLLFYKRNYEANFLGNDTSGFENLLKIFLIVAFVLKTLDVIHLIIRQTRIDIFFMDWERSKTGKFDGVSVWRTYFVANEFNEIQTFRRINLPFQLFFVLFFLKVINLENLSYNQSSISLAQSNFNSTEYNQVFRTGIAFFALGGTALLQYFVYTMIFQRMIADKIVNFIDLCSVSNISVFILDENQHGYYIHGRSPHGTTDVNMRDLLMNFYREENRMSATRGLENNSDEQIFIVRTNTVFRRQYELLFRSYYNSLGRKKTREDAERTNNLLFQSYHNLNSFLCAFIDRSLASHQYIIRNRYLLEKILDYEFQLRNAAGLIDNLLFVDNERTFTKILFYGEEGSLFLWNTATFLFIDVLSGNYVLAAVITYLLNSFAAGLRNSFGRRNLSKKTLIPRNFLI